MRETMDERWAPYFWISFPWGAITGWFTYIVLRFPWWLVLNVPDDGQRGPFLLPVEALATALLGMATSAALFWVLMRSRNRFLVSLGYPLTAVLLPFMLSALIIFPLWYVSPGSSDWMEPVAGWVLMSLLPQVCSLPFGLLSALIFSRLMKSSKEA